MLATSHWHLIDIGQHQALGDIIAIKSFFCRQVVEVLGVSPTWYSPGLVANRVIQKLRGRERRQELKSLTPAVCVGDIQRIVGGEAGRGHTIAHTAIFREGPK